MSSEFAQFLFSFACNKLETSPQLDLRQQLLHSNLIRHILLTHHHQLDESSKNEDLERQRLLALPPLPPSPPPVTPSPSPVPQSLNQSCKKNTTTTQSTPSDLYGLDPSFQPFQPLPQHKQHQHLAGVAIPHWSPFCFEDELERIHHDQAMIPAVQQGPTQVPVQDQDVIMEETTADMFPAFVYFRDGYNHINPAYYGPPPSLMERPYDRDEDDEDYYRFATSQAQDDWLDAVLEDLIEEDQQDDFSPEYDSEEDELFCDDTEDIELVRGGVGGGKTVVAAVQPKPDKTVDILQPRPSSAWSTQRDLFPDCMILDPGANTMWP
ncbi:hypothetical protein BGX28_007062 [Mortierella sp. GBA30]|nr:hypothetical protein BGX28_007062 [Mortierella sp. GBA30]